MKNIEQWLRERLRGARTDDAVDADQLWNRLEKELPAPGGRRESSGPRLTSYPLLLTVLAVVAFSVFIGLFGPTDPRTESSPTLIADMASPSPSSEPTASVLPAGSAPQHNNPRGDVPSSPSLKPDPGTQSGDPVGGAAVAGDAAPTTSAVVVADPATRRLFLGAAAPLPLTAIADLPTEAYTDFTTDTLREATAPQATFKRAPGSRWAVSLLGGSQVSFPKFSSGEEGDLAEKLGGASGQVAGGSVTVEGTFRLAPSWAISSGLGLTKAVTSFEYRYSYDTVAVFSGVERPALATRRVSHNNRSLGLSVPLSVEWRASLRRIELGAFGGAAINFALRQRGKTLDRDAAVVAYDRSTSQADRPLPAHWMSYHLQPFLRYRTGPMLAIELRGTMVYQRYGLSPLWQLNGSALQSGVQVGIRIGR